LTSGFSRLRERLLRIEEGGIGHSIELLYQQRGEQGSLKIGETVFLRKEELGKSDDGKGGTKTLLQKREVREKPTHRRGKGRYKN